jgi:Lar family restriction alleviation protein
VENKELKPCPFCGGEAEVIDGPCNSWQVMCGGCFAKADWSNDSCAKAIAAWNTRPDPWIRITPETMPEEDGEYWVLGRAGQKGCVGYSVKYGWTDFQHIRELSMLADEITHYQPIQLPKEGE